MHKRNIATAMLSLLGFDRLFQSAMPINPIAERAKNSPPRGGTRWGRSSQLRARRKAEFADTLAAEFRTPKHTKLARKAHMGEVGLRGPRGLQVRRVDGVLRVTR